MPKVLILAGDAAEDLETMFIKYRLAEADHEPHIAAPTMRPIKLVVHDFEPDWDTYVERQGRTCPVDVTFAQVEPAEYAALVIPGGRAPEYIRDDEDLIRATQWFFANNKPIASVCHGVEIPARAGCVKGRKMATVAKCKFDLEVCGGTYVNEPCVVDGNLVSGRTFHDNGLYLGPWIKMLVKAREAAKK